MKKEVDPPKRKMFKPDKERYYYIRNMKVCGKPPRITVCLLRVGKIIAKGVSICSFSEKEINRCEGRGKAKGRAIEALREKRNCNKILRDEAREVTKLSSWSDGLIYKSEYNPTLNSYEDEIMSAQ